MGACKMKIDPSNGEYIYDKEYNYQHTVPKEFTGIIKDVLIEMSKEKFGLGENAHHVVSQWQKWISGRFKLKVDDAWVEGKAWTPTVIDSTSFWELSRHGGERGVSLPAIVTTTNHQDGYAIINILHLPETPVDVRHEVERRVKIISWELCKAG